MLVKVKILQQERHGWWESEGGMINTDAVQWIKRATPPRGVLGPISEVRGRDGESILVEGTPDGIMDQIGAEG